jgi:two-component system KDP operon response regulator KdpE
MTMARNVSESPPQREGASPSDVRARAILVIDDEVQMRRAIHNGLVRVAERVLEAGTAQEGIDIAAAEQPDLVILDLGLPDRPGLEVCREIRSWMRVPIIVLSARHSEEEKIRLLDAGADDYITKPFSLRELEARVRVQLRRAIERGLQHPVEIRTADLYIDLGKRRVTRNDAPVHLTPIEWRIIRALIAAAGRTLTHRQIFDAVWGRAYGDPQRYLRVYVTHLRRKLEADPTNPKLIMTEPGVGYRVELDG